jgi:Phage capsid family
MVTGLMERGHQGERTLAQRWAAASSDPAYISAFGKYVLDPQNLGAALTREEQAAYQTAREVRGWVEGTPASAGWLVPITLDASVMLTGAGVRSPIRNVARVEQITSDRWRGISSAGTTAEFKAEAVAVTPVTPTVAVPEVPVHFLSVFTKFSIEIQQDGLRLLENLQKIQQDAAITKTENAYATGTSVGEPQGLVTGLAAVAASVIAPTTAEVYGKLDPIKLQNDPGRPVPAQRLVPDEPQAAQRDRGIRAEHRRLDPLPRGPQRPDAQPQRLRDEHARLGLRRGGHGRAELPGSLRGLAQVLPYRRPNRHLDGGHPAHLQFERKPDRRARGLAYARTGSGVIVPEAGRVLDVPTAA